MSDVGRKVYNAEQEGEMFCKVCDKYIDLGDPKGYDETRDKILEHHTDKHQ